MDSLGNTSRKVVDRDEHGGEERTHPKSKKHNHERLDEVNERIDGLCHLAAVELRERREDIPLLATHFLSRYCREYSRNITGFSQETVDALSSYAWPGNIRELENEVQRLVIQGDDNGLLEPSHLSPQLRKVEGTLARIAPKKGTLKEMVEQVERWLLTEALRDHDNNQTRTAVTLGITREGLHTKLTKYGM